ncbi:c-type cytochrome [Rhizobium sp. CSW-27]|uniref:c-type cytochrome n=1 Tax=Rhizobium sp. CSW-27 TaxID=2839985 RepID=UPI001C039693|nr:c-type cytochrome [Rhizobium sp. CSW-27]MBT9369106.1 c-type cytochrome [Rhizobium sp. CSW-27]
MFIRWRYLVAAAIAAPLLGLVLAWSGLVGIGAASGHWPITDWFLHWSMRSSTRTAALGISVPPLDNPQMLPMAAGHFEQGCAMCHGSPAAPRSAVVFGMLPVPPDLKPRVPIWSDAELFQIVQHGVRFTGMPAWPSQQREDEVWAMVAFLRKLPGMTASEYRQLAGLAAPLRPGMSAALDCNACHAENRLTGESLIPSLAGQSEAYLRASLMAYLKGERQSGIMQTAVNGLNANDVAGLAARFTGERQRAGAPAPVNPRGADVAAGQALARSGRPEDRIPACLSCHEREDGNPLYPRLFGQSAPYLAGQLRLFRDGERGGTRFHHLMVRAADNLTDADIDNLAAYFAAGRDADR